MKGVEFCELVHQYMMSSETTGGFVVIKSNPDQSTHLETARMFLLDVWIDVAHLRSEGYGEISSRIPTMVEIGTPEDFTERGMDDLLIGRRIVTPLPPKKTFLDDPLRVLRAIRFGARLGNVLATEVDLMVPGDEPVEAMACISDLMLFGTVFTLPVSFEPGISDGYEILCVAHMRLAWGLLKTIGSSFITIEQRRLCLYAALLLPFREMVHKDSKTRWVPVDEIRQFIDVDWKGETIDVCATKKIRILVGLLLRDMKDNWRLALVLSMLLISTADIHSAQQMYKVVEDCILGQGLDEVWKVKPLVNGKQIMTVLDLRTGGPLVGEWQQNLLQWQLAHPSGTENECMDWMIKSLS
ncbi:OLC1v1014308C1 [Oldenlandia corymbosa var. corymbosa]|uniref:OLC1v1014308C1 n=1 Tax=Oldenlandia corymbosa var. corymbosa TaxID=529605 RepID=A0AAV1E3P2_OLDCO|nr:OLC1v1014308C1 [Oldenlandia corymbosa var. corymbosa]